jgi:hypothetical protein
VRSLVLIAFACGSPRPSPVEPVEPVGQMTALPADGAHVPRVISKPPARCSIRIVRSVITVDGDPMKLAHAVSVCKQSGVALLEVVDAASEAEALRLEVQLHYAGVTIMTRSPRRYEASKK